MIEGLDGSGQTTQARLLVRWLNGQCDCGASYTKEPTDGPVGAIIRMALRGRLTLGEGVGESRSLDELTMALFFAADRADHVGAEIGPRLAAGQHVVSDRYYLSSIAYQSGTIDRGWLLEINKHALRPTLTIFLDVPASECLRRINESRWRKERYERSEALEAAYRAFNDSIRHLRELGDHIEVVDGCQSISAIQKCIANIVTPYIANECVNSRPTVAQSRVIP